MTRSATTCLDGEVVRIQDLGPTFRRITFGGEGLADFGLHGDPLDLRVKLVIPPDGVTARSRFDLPALLDDCARQGLGWYREWRALPEEERGTMRTYTVRAWREDVRELDIDMVMHVDADGHSGPAAAWAKDARVGDRLHIIGPHREAAGGYGGIEFLPEAARDLLIAGDETAVPAISSILGSLPDDATGCALLEVPSEADVEASDAPVPPGVEVRWLVRGDAPVGTLLEPAVREVVRTPLCVDSETSAVHRAVEQAELEDVDVDAVILWDTPALLTQAAHASAPVGEAGDNATGDDAAGAGHHRFYAWIAGEAGVVKSLRRYLVREVGVDRHQVAFMGYWRLGRAES